MRRFILALAVVVLAWFGHRAYAQARLQRLMAEKLQHAQKILEGMALGDFDKMAKHADELQQLATKAEWLAYNTNRYETHSNEFRRALDNLARRARDKNVDGATLAYFDLTMSCVRCHQYVREQRDARLPVLPREAFADTRIPVRETP